MMRVAFVSLHSHGDRSFLDDNALALASGRARRRGHPGELVVVALDGRAADPTEGPAFAALVAALAGFDVVVYERTWTRRIPEALMAACPTATFVHWRGEHALDDPPGHYQVETRAQDALLDHLAGRRASLPVGAARRTAAGWQPGLGALPVEAPAPFAPNLHPIVVNPDALPAQRVFSIDGNPGCPYQADARANPRYAGVELPDGLGRGCGFCTTGNHHVARPQAEVLEDVFAQLAYVRREAPELTQLVLRDQNPLGYLGALLARCAAEGVGGFTLLLQTRADWLLAGARRFGEILDRAAAARITITPFLVGIESFSQDELDRMNKGVTVADNRALLAALRGWADHPAFDLSGASFGFILFTPWTTMADLRAAYDGIVATDFDRLRGRLLTARVRLYPDTALYYLAAKDGLLADDGASPQPGRYGYYPDRAWRFADPVVGHFAELAAAVTDATDGRDQRRVFRTLLDAFAAAPAPQAITPARILAALAAPPIGARARGAVAAGARRRTLELELGGGCGRACGVCPPAGAGAPIASTLAGGGARVVVRGGGGDRARVVAAVAAARAAGVDEIVVAGHVEDLAEPGAAAALAAAGVDAVALVVVSQVAKVHDRAVGRADSLVATLVAARALAAAGVAIELELPIVPARLQDLAAIVVLFARAVPSVRAVRCYLPRHPMPTALAPPPLADLGPRLDAALAAAEACGARATFDVTAAVPLCALAGWPRLGAAARFDPRRPTRVGGCVKPSACAGCAVAAQCPGLPASYRAAHGARDVRPLATRPPALYAQRTTPPRVWDEPARAAARAAGLLVLRPTVHCNQDCGFCSANESTPNVWAEPRAMMRAIARAAQRGVERVSFSGGEPTLARELPSYVRVARRAGIAKVELVTNGVLLDQPTRVDALVAAGLTHAFVSLHGHDEASASAATRKAGDFARTIAAIGHLVERGVITVVNHVIHAGNAALLERFVDIVWERFGGRVMISFAFVTPQYQALQHPELVPRLSEVAPYLARAAWRAIDLGQPFVIGSRQGVPPCQLGPFVGWSDLIHVAHEAQAEDAPQKVHGPGCTGCRFARYCTGVWRPYAARYGTDELVAPPGPPLGEPERAVLLAHARRPPWGQPMAFADVHPWLRDRAAEERGPPPRPTAAPLPPRVVGGDRPLRALMIGSGPRAVALARAAAAAGGWAIAGVCSPHAAVRDRAPFAGAPAFATVAEAIEATRPDAVIVASATASHGAAATAAIAAGAPVLIEKPLAGSLDEARAVVAAAAAAAVPLMVGHNDRFAAGLDRALAAAVGRPLSIVRTSAPHALAAWQRAPLFEALYHLMVLAHGHGATAIAAARWRGDDRPRWLRLALDGAAPIAMTWTLAGASDALVVAAPGVHWRRAGRTTTVTLAGAVSAPRDGGELERMLREFHAVVRERQRPPLATGEDALAVMTLTAAAIEALTAAGAPIHRATAPRHAATPALAPRYR